MANGAIPSTFKRELTMPEFRILIWSILLILLSSCKSSGQQSPSPYLYDHGAIVRGDTSASELALVFTGDEFADGGMHIIQVLEQQGLRASFFLTGKFYRNPEFEELINKLRTGGHYLGAHSDRHLLYCDWEKRDSLLVSREEFIIDLENNYRAMQSFGLEKEDALFYLPPYEWYNETISLWTREMGLHLVNLTYGTLSHADYTLPGNSGYRKSQEIYESILNFEASRDSGLRGFILLSHIGTAPQRNDKFYLYLEDLIKTLKSRGYRFQRIDELLSNVP